MKHWWAWLLGGVVLAWGLSLFMVRHWTKKRLLADLNQEESGMAGMEISLEEPRPEELQALEVVRAYRRRFLLSLSPGTGLSFGAITDTAQNLVRDIAQVYYPEEDRPELRASLADLVGLYNRVGERLSRWLETLPARPFKDVELSTVFWVHETYQKVTQHSAYQFLKRQHLDRAARWLWTVKNAANPWYWSRRAVVTGGKEAFARLFLAQVASLVGEEAIHLYGRRDRKAAGGGTGNFTKGEKGKREKGEKG